MVTDSASREDNRPFEDSTRHDDIWAVHKQLDTDIWMKNLDDSTDNEVIENIESACKTALKEIEKIKGTKY